MEEPLLRYKSMAPLLCEAELEGMACNTPVPFYDTTVACGNPKDTEDAHIYDIQGNRLDDVRKGVNIIRTKDGKTKKVMVK